MIIGGASPERIVRYVVDEYRRLDDARSDKKAIWNDCIAAYLSKFNKVWAVRAQQEGRSARYLAVTWDAVENVHAQLSSMLFPGEEWLQLRPIKPGGEFWDDAMAEDMRDYLLWQHRQMGFSAEIKSALKQLIITGNCPWSLDWRTDWAVNYPAYAQAMQMWAQEQQIAQAQFQMQLQQWQMVNEQAIALGQPAPPMPQIAMPPQPAVDQEKAYDGPGFSCGDIFNFVIDNHANDPRSAFRAQRLWRTKAWLKKFTVPDETGYQMYQNLDQVQETDRRDKEGETYETQRAEAFGLRIPTERKGVEIIEAWGTFEIPGAATGGDGVATPTVFENYVAVVANGRTLLRFEPSYLWSRDLPRQLMTLIPVPGEVYGMGLVEQALSTQDLLNVRTNQLVDAAAIAINPEYKYVDDAITDPRAKSSPGKRHQVGTLENLQPLVKDLSGLNLSFSEIGQLKAEFQQLTRSSNAFTTQHYKKTATEIQRDSSQTSASLNEIARHVENVGIKSIIELQIQLNQQFADIEQIFAVTQHGELIWKQVSPETVRQKWDVVVQGSEHLAMKQERIQQLLMFTQMAVGNPMTAQVIDPSYLLRAVYREMGFQDEDKAIPGVNPYQQAMMAGPAGLLPGMMGDEYGGYAGSAGDNAAPAEGGGDLPDVEGAGLAGADELPGGPPEGVLPMPANPRAGMAPPTRVPRRAAGNR